MDKFYFISLKEGLETISLGVHIFEHNLVGGWELSYPQVGAVYINYKGDKANAYLNGNLVADSFYDGTDWILSLSRLKGTIETNPLVLRIDGLKSADANIYFEKNVNPEKCVTPTLDAIKVKQEYRFRFNR